MPDKREATPTEGMDPNGGPLAIALLRIGSAQTIVKAVATQGTATLAEVDMHLRKAKMRLMDAVAAIDDALGEKVPAGALTADGVARSAIQGALDSGGTMQAAVVAILWENGATEIVEEPLGAWGLHRSLSRYLVRSLLGP